MYTCVCVQVCLETRTWLKFSGALELELHVLVSRPVWMLGPELLASGRAACGLHHRAIFSPPLLCVIHLFTISSSFLHFQVLFYHHSFTPEKPVSIFCNVQFPGADFSHLAFPGRIFHSLLSFCLETESHTVAQAPKKCLCSRLASNS